MKAFAEKCRLPALPARIAGRLTMALFGLITCLPAHADLESVRHILEERYRQNKKPFSPESLRETLIPGLYYWDQGPYHGQIYVNEAATLLMGTDSVRITEWAPLVTNPKPIPDADRKAMLDEMLKNIRLDRLIHIWQGKGRRRVLLLSAFDCPFCIKLERELMAWGDRADIDLYILPATLEAHEPARLESVRNIWCAADNAKAWRETTAQAGRGYSVPAPHECDLRYAFTRDIEVLLKSAGLKMGYPLAIFPDGTVETAGTEGEDFLNQLRQYADNRFWIDPHPEKYAQYQPVGAVKPPVEQAKKLLNGLFRFGGKSLEQDSGVNPSAAPSQEKTSN